MSAHFRIICTCHHNSGSSAHVSTLQDHLHMSAHFRIICTCHHNSGSSAHVKHFKIICTGQTPQHDLHRSTTAALHTPCAGDNAYTWVCFQHRESVEKICAFCSSLSLLEEHQLVNKASIYTNTFARSARSTARHLLNNRGIWP